MYQFEPALKKIITSLFLFLFKKSKLSVVLCSVNAVCAHVSIKVKCTNQERRTETKKVRSDALLDLLIEQH